MANNINDAARGAADWLINLTRKDSKFNPMPFGMFKSCINKQISWAQQAGITLSFDAIASLVKARLNNAGIQVQQDNRRRGWNFKDYPEDILGETAQQVQPAQQVQQDVSFTLSILEGDDNGAGKLISWLHEVISKARQDLPHSVRFTAHFSGGANNGQNR